jgi:hypothetical protein
VNYKDNIHTILYTLLIIGVQYCMKVVFVVLLIIGVQYCMNVVCVVLLIIGVQYFMNVELQTTFIPYCTPIIKRTTDNIHAILYTYNQVNYKDNIHTILYTYNQEKNVVFVVLLIIGVQYCMNVVCSSLDYRCTILYECCLFISLDTPVIKRTTDNIHAILYTYNQVNYKENIHTILYTNNQENYKDNIHTILYTNNQENYRQHSYNIVHLLWCTILHEYCL